MNQNAPEATAGPFRLGAEQRHMQEVARQIARDRYRPRAEEWDAQRTPFPKEERLRLGELGFLGISLPEQYGGLGLPLMDSLVVIEELAKECRPAAFQVFEANTGPAQAINQIGTDEQREELLPRVISGDITIAVAISEPEAGSAATDLTTRAVRGAGGYVLNGTKRWISNGGEADFYVVYTRLSDDPGGRGIGALIVDGSSDGVSYGSPERLMGFRGIPSNDIIFDDVIVPEGNLLVGAGKFRELLASFSIERLGNSTVSLGIGQAALEKSIAYSQERRQFGKELIEFQAVQMQIADMALAVEGARVLIQRAAIEAGNGLPSPLLTSLAKCTANEMAKTVSDMAMQIHGGNGYSEEYGIERLHRDAHGWAIAGGTPTMQRTRIVSEMLGRRFDQRIK